jgi:hypothetical protein
MKRIITICAAILLNANIFAQSPEKMSYQAVIRNSSDALVVNTQISMQISILQGSTSGMAVFVETQTPTTNDNGLVSIEIGGGKVVNGDLSTIDWANGSYYIKIETDPAGGTNYTITGTSQLLSVPYALHAKTAETVGEITETDPIFGSSVASKITIEDTLKWNNKSDFSGDYNDLYNKPTFNVSLTGDTLFFGDDFIIIPGISKKNNPVMEVNDFFVDTLWGWPDGIVALSNDTVIFVMEDHSLYGKGLVRAVRGDTLDISDYISGPGSPYNSPDGLTVLNDGRLIVTDGQAHTAFIVPAAGGSPEIFVSGIPSYCNSAVAPVGFDGINVNPGDVVIPSWLAPKIVAVNPDTKVQKTLIEQTFFTGFCSEGVAAVEFGSDNNLYVMWSDYWGDREQPRIYRFDSEGNGELFFQFTDWDYEGMSSNNFDICLNNDWLYYFYHPTKPTEYSGDGTIFRMSLDGTINEFVIDLNWGCQSLELSPDGSRLFVGCAGRIKELVLND